MNDLTLTPNQLRLLTLFANGYNGRQAMEECNWTEGQLFWCQSSLYNKLGASTRAQAVYHAMQRGLIK